eukprot:TRINITY_DN2004_c0_g1_i1.p1 TRINITY_DN2004_c0_g1~~TRINITY_DN2004_c0_g1_i1.p1  ORF type:complete len:233 (+),score=35.64 TRINITY_DN2004_c0_g1_i1:802-1500(+)
MQVRGDRINQLEAENSRYLSELQRYQSRPSASSEEVRNLKKDLERKDNYIANLQASLSQMEQKNAALKRECEGLRGDLDRQRQHYVHGPAPNTPVLKQHPKKVLQIQKVPTMPKPKAFPGKKSGWSSLTASKTSRVAQSPKKAMPGVNSTSARSIQRPRAKPEEASVNNLAPRLLQRPTSSVTFGNLESNTGWNEAKKVAKNPSVKAKPFDKQFGDKNPFDFTGEHNKKKKK